MDATLLNIDLGDPDTPNISIHPDEAAAIKHARALVGIGNHVPDENVLAEAYGQFDTIDLGMNLGLHEKCSLCHLFVAPNDVQGLGIAEYVHLSRGDEADEKLEDHEARPSGMVATLATWRVFGPSAMRERFVILNPYGPNPLER